MKIRFLLLGTSLSFIPSLTSAQCVATQDCATLGYTETSCSGGSGVKCPFGNKWACFKSDSEVCQQYGFTLSCTGTGQLGKGESCANLYKQCDCQSTYKYACSGTGYSGGSGSACGGKYAQCSCSSEYEWKDGRCQILNGPDENVYKCNGKVVGVKTSEMDFYVAIKDLGSMNWNSANSSCQSYIFCDNIKGTLPSNSQLKTIYNNKSTINSLLSTNSGTKMTEADYWSSTGGSYGGSYGYHYIVDMSNGGHRDNVSSYNSHYVRPILTSW